MKKQELIDAAKKRSKSTKKVKSGGSSSVSLNIDLKVDVPMLFVGAELIKKNVFGDEVDYKKEDKLFKGIQQIKKAIIEYSKTVTTLNVLLQLSDGQEWFTPEANTLISVSSDSSILNWNTDEITHIITLTDDQIKLLAGKSNPQ